MISDELLFKVLTGRATPKEQEAVAAWRSRSRPNEERYQVLARILAVSTDADAPRAAVRPPTAADLLAAGRPRTRQGLAGRKLRLSIPRALHLRRSLPWAAVFVLALGVALLWPASSVAPAFAVRELVTGASEAVTVVLGDGTVVRLAPRSRLRFNEAAGDRAVSLTGRAYFAVTKDETRPFRISTSSGEVRVLGTRFDLEVAPENLRVTVVEGRVAIAPEAGGEEELLAGQVGRIVRGTPLPPEAVDDPTAMIDWVGNFVAFESTPLRDAVREIERLYGIRVQMSVPALADRTLTFHFADWTLSEAMEAVCLIVHARCSIDADRDLVTMAPL